MISYMTANGMCARALIICESIVTGRIRYVAFMVWAIEIDTVPARGKDDGSTNAAGTRLVGELRRVVGIAGCATTAGNAFTCFETSMTDTW
jgi:hypothetical protein